ncbi:MAG: DUF4339 domain-containing protein [Geminicoccaceae bacterium]
MDDVSRKYYCYIDEQEVGPLSFDEIIQLGITPDTPVWYEGVTDWRPASSFPEFKPAFNASEPPPAPLPAAISEGFGIRTRHASATDKAIEWNTGKPIAEQTKSKNKNTEAKFLALKGFFILFVDLILLTLVVELFDLNTGPQRAWEPPFAVLVMIIIPAWAVYYFVKAFQAWTRNK